MRDKDLSKRHNNREQCRLTTWTTTQDSSIHINQQLTYETQTTVSSFTGPLIRVWSWWFAGTNSLKVSENFKPEHQRGAQWLHPTPAWHCRFGSDNIFSVFLASFLPVSLLCKMSNLSAFKIRQWRGAFIFFSLWTPQTPTWNEFHRREINKAMKLLSVSSLRPRGSRTRTCILTYR